MNKTVRLVIMEITIAEYIHKPSCIILIKSHKVIVKKLTLFLCAEV